MELDMKKLGLAIKYSRESKGLTQAELGKRVGLSTSAIGMYEKARRIPGIDTLVKIAHTTSKDINDFLFYIDENGNPINTDNKNDSNDYNKNESNQDNFIDSIEKHETISAHSTKNQLSKEDIEDVMTILSILKKR